MSTEGDRFWIEGNPFSVLAGCIEDRRVNGVVGVVGGREIGSALCIKGGIFGLTTAGGVPIERLVIIFAGRGDDERLGNSHNVCCLETRFLGDSCGGCSVVGVGKLIVDTGAAGGGVEKKLVDGPATGCGCILINVGAADCLLDIDWNGDGGCNEGENEGAAPFSGFDSGGEENGGLDGGGGFEGAGADGLAPKSEVGAGLPVAANGLTFPLVTVRAANGDTWGGEAAVLPNTEPEG